MNAKHRTLLITTLAAATMITIGHAQDPVEASALEDVTLYEEEFFQGRSISIDQDKPSLSLLDFNDRPSSVQVSNGVWLLCDDANFGGRCKIIDADITRLRDIGLRRNISSVKKLPINARPAKNSIIFFSDRNYSGSGIAFSSEAKDLTGMPFYDSVDSIFVGEESCLVYTEVNFEGTCQVVSSSSKQLTKGSLTSRVSSVRRAIASDLEPDTSNDVQQIAGASRSQGYSRIGQTGCESQFDYRASHAVEGQDTVFYPFPTNQIGQPIPYSPFAADSFCENELHGTAIHQTRQSEYLADVLCKKKRN